MSNIITRAGKGSPLTNEEIDQNFLYLDGKAPLGDGFAAGTMLTFAQASAPTGWIQITDDTANGRMLRLVSDHSGGGRQGIHSPTYCNVVPAHTHSFTTANPSADHTHFGSTGNVSADHAHGIGDPGHYHRVYDTWGNPGPTDDPNIRASVSNNASVS